MKGDISFNHTFFKRTWLIVERQNEDSPLSVGGMASRGAGEQSIEGLNASDGGKRTGQCDDETGSRFLIRCASDGHSPG